MGRARAGVKWPYRPGAASPPISWATGEFREEGGYHTAHSLLRLANQPTALLFANNLMTLVTMRAARELGVRLPDDLALIAFDDSEWHTRPTRWAPGPPSC